MKKKEQSIRALSSLMVLVNENFKNVSFIELQEKLANLTILLQETRKETSGQYIKLQTTLSKIKSYTPYKIIWNDLLEKMGQDIDNPNLETEVSLRFIFNSLGLDVALYLSNCFTELNNSIKWFSLWCAERVRHLMKDERSINALDVTKRYLKGNATLEEIEHASEAAWDAHEKLDNEREDSKDAAWVAWSASAHSENVAYLTASSSRDAFYAAGLDETQEKKAQAQEFLRMLDCYERGIEYTIKEPK